MVFKLRPEIGQDTSRAEIRGRSVPDRRTRKPAVCEARIHLVYLKLSVAETPGARGTLATEKGRQNLEGSGPPEGEQICQYKRRKATGKFQAVE